MPTPVAHCGWECGVTDANLHWTAVLGSFSFSAADARNGAARGLIIAAADIRYFQTSYALSSTALVWRYYIQFGSLPTSDAMLSSETNGACGVAFKQSDSKIYAGSNETTPAFGATGVVVTTGIWYRIDVKVNASANPRLVDVQVDGVACGQHSLAVASATLTAIRIGSGVAETVSYTLDDFIVSQTAGDYPMGPGYVDQFLPTSDGTHNVAGTNDFERTLTGTDIDNTTTTAFQLVDDQPLESSSSVDWINLIAPPNATDYVEVVFGPGTGATTPTIPPRAVEFLAAYHALATQNNNLRIAYRDNNGGTQDDVRNATVGSTQVIYTRKRYATIPGGGAWTVTAFNNSRARCYSSDPAPDPYVDGYMIEAEWPEQAAGNPYYAYRQQG